MIEGFESVSTRGKQGIHAGIHPGNPCRALWKYLFKKYPCKNCLVVACCSEFCEESVIFRETIIHWTMTKHYYRIRMKGIGPENCPWCVMDSDFPRRLIIVPFILLSLKAS